MLQTKLRSGAVFPFCFLAVSTPGGASSRRVLAVWDLCSTDTFIKDSIARELGMSMERRHIELTTVDSFRSSRVLKQVQLLITGVGRFKPVALTDSAYVVPRVTSPVPPIPLARDQLPLGLAAGTLEGGEVELLLGNKSCYTWLTGPITKLTSDVSVIGTKVGGLLFGPGHRPAQSTALAVETERVTNEDLDLLLSKFWEIEEIPSQALEVLSVEDQAMVDQFNREIVFDGTRYVVPLAFRSERRPLNNFHAAMARLRGIESKYKRNPELAQQYSTAINRLVEDGTARELGVVSRADREGRSFFLPHRGV